MEDSPLGPEDVSSLYEGLRQALSPDINVQKAAESTLKGLEARQGFCSCLAVCCILVQIPFHESPPRSRPAL